MAALYTLSVGIMLAAVGAAEMMAPRRAFDLWRRWASSRAFFTHGIILIAGGIPLAIYRGPASIPAVVIGVVAALTGPFILLFPDRIRGMFESIAGEMDEGDIRRMMRVEAAVRVLAGASCVVSYFLAW